MKRRYLRFDSLLFPVEHVKNSLLIALACGLTSTVAQFVTHPLLPNGSLSLLTLVLPNCIQYLIIGTLLSLFLRKNNGFIHCAEVFSWSWKGFSRYLKDRGILVDLLIGLVIGCIFASKDVFQSNFIPKISGALIFSGAITIGLCLIFAISQSITSNRLSDHHRTIPNEGIKRSLYHGNVSFGIGTAASFKLRTSC